MNIALAYNVKRHEPSLDPKQEEDIEFDSPFVIHSIAKAIKKAGHSVIKIEANESSFTKLKKDRAKIDLVFNIAEGLRGDARESQIPIFCELLSIPYTHSSPTTHALGLNKEYCKDILRAHNILTPNSQVFITGEEAIDNKLKFPLIVKPNKEGSSKGVFDKSVVENSRQLKQLIRLIVNEFKHEALVEEFIDGREFTVAIVGNEQPKILPIIEQRFDFLPKGMKKIASFELKWIYEDSLKNQEDAYYCPAPITKEVQKKIEETTLKIFKLLSVRDVARIDYRLDKSNNLYFIEINTLPGLNPDPKIISYLPLAVRKSGMTFEQFINEIITLASKRYSLA